MTRTKTGFVRRRWHKKILKLTKGQWDTRHKNHRRANEAMIKSFFYAYRDRRQRKRDLRRLWIVRVNAAARLNGVSYSKLMFGLKNAGVSIDRKMLADVAVRDPQTFTKIAALSLQNQTPGATTGKTLPVGVVRIAGTNTLFAGRSAAFGVVAEAEAPAGVDQLTRIEGLGPKSAAALNQAGITTFAQIAALTGDQLYEIVHDQGGVKVVAGQTQTWPKQAQFLVAGDLDGFKAYTDRLVGGREPDQS